MKALAGLAVLGLAYAAGSAAIHTGRWLFYFITFALIITGLKLLIGSLRRDKE